jgi:hypothetical protein
MDTSLLKKNLKVEVENACPTPKLTGDITNTALGRGCLQGEALKPGIYYYLNKDM